MRIIVAIQDYTTCQEINKSSILTINQRRRVLGNFASWLESTYTIVDTDDIQLVHLRAWVAYLQKVPNLNDVRFGKKGILTDTSVHHYANLVAGFCHWLEYEGVIEKPITTRFKLPKKEEKVIFTYTPDEVQRLLDACEAGCKDKPQLCKALTARNRAIVTVLLDTGIRRKELVGLRLGDIDREMRLLLIHRKGNKWQQVPISREGFRPLHDYLMKYRPYLAKLGGVEKSHKEDAVFLSDEGQPITVSGVSNFFHRLQRISGIMDKPVSPHNCRRYMATTQHAMGRDSLDIQRQMGHTTPSMTNRYIKMSTDQLKRSHDEHSPMRLKGVNEVKNEGTGYWDEE